MVIKLVRQNIPNNILLNSQTPSSPARLSARDRSIWFLSEPGFFSGRRGVRRDQPGGELVRRRRRQRLYPLGQDGRRAHPHARQELQPRHESVMKKMLKSRC